MQIIMGDIKHKITNQLVKAVDQPTPVVGMISLDRKKL
jgi:hypothetical protein